MAKSPIATTAGANTTVADLIKLGAQQLTAAGVVFGHGSDNARDEAAELVFFACGLKHEDAPNVYSQVTTEAQRVAALKLLSRRVDERIPAAYLTRRMWFCGHEFYVDARVLVPRSPLAEIIAARFSPWADADEINTVLDIGTGSGCIAIATALELAHAKVTAADIASDALAVTEINIDRFALRDRVTAVKSDLFTGLESKRYDLIISNPPYVSAAEVQALPPEYHREPQIGLLAGGDGLSVVRRILREAAGHLTANGTLIVEVGDTETTLADAYPRVPFMWLEFARGGGGVFLLSAAQLKTHAKDFESR